ncbi:hypothetical protein ALMP_06780 [Streptomyces sp. A012304]|nr:hypothetical protein ALMP_06780 [Streptomyces sp. A012304]
MEPGRSSGSPLRDSTRPPARLVCRVDHGTGLGPLSGRRPAPGPSSGALPCPGPGICLRRPGPRVRSLAGFADQSQSTGWFVRSHGVTPGHFPAGGRAVVVTGLGSARLA